MVVASQFRSAARLVLGGIQHATQGRTPDAAYQSLISLFCRTGGRSSDRLSQLVALANPPYKLPEARGVAGDFDAGTLKEITRDLDVHGYHVFENRLPADLCESLLKFALTNPCSVRASSGSGGSSKPFIVDAYDPGNLLGHRYDFSGHDIVNNADVQRLMADHSLLAVAQSYLRCKPVLDVMGMWWHTAFGEEPDAEAAQFYHFDMDRIKWVKFFIYLTDVGPENGPHCFIEGSHRTGGIPAELLEKGYSRLTDAEVSANYSDDRFVEFTAPRGTIIAEDTRGLHKGKHVRKGDRLMLQLQFSNSLFGGYYPPANIATVLDLTLADMVERFPRIYSNYLK
jgi:hypothetical protein